MSTKTEQRWVVSRALQISPSPSVPAKAWKRWDAQFKMGRQPERGSPSSDGNIERIFGANQMTNATWIDRRPGGKFPETFRFEFRSVFKPLPIGTSRRPAAVCDEPRTVIWMDQNNHTMVHVCHVVTESLWSVFLVQDDTLDLLEVDEPRRSELPEWRISGRNFWAWDLFKGQGVPRSMPDHLLPMDSGLYFSPLDDEGRSTAIRLAQPILDWWPQLYSPNKVVLPNPVKRRIEYGPLERYLAQPDTPSTSLITGRR